MRIAIACFSERGREAAERLAAALSAAGDEMSVTRCGGDSGQRVGEWAAANFTGNAALIFIGATGIAVRAIAPLLAGKTRDPAVVVVDDGEHHAISLLSGHVGGANALTIRVATALGATPVITTATDVAGVFAVDVWAVGRGLVIDNPEAIKRVSAKMLSGEPVFYATPFPVTGNPPLGWRKVDDAADVRMDVREAPDSALLLIPRILTLGVGCRRGTAEAAITEAFGNLCRRHCLSQQAFRAVASIDVKADEAGLLAFCERRALPFLTYDAKSLAAVEGSFSSSRFVEKTVGVDTVCERSAVLESGGRLLVEKTAADGIALAVAMGGYTVDFAGSAETVR